jgi:hypothetical protein
VFDGNPALVHAAAEKAYGFVRKNGGKPSWPDYLDILATRGAPSSLKERWCCPVGSASFHTTTFDTLPIRSPLRIAFPLAWRERLFPDLFAEAVARAEPAPALTV